MHWGKAVGLALAGCGLLATAPATALAGDENASLQDRIRELEKQVQELRELQSRGGSQEPLGSAIERYLQGSEKGELWRDRNGGPLSKAVKSVSLWGSFRTRPEWTDNWTDQNRSVDDSGVQTFTRVRLGLGTELAKDISTVLELNFAGNWGNAPTGLSTGVRDARLFDATYGNSSGFQAAFLQQAYIQAKECSLLGMGVRLGRSEMKFGDEYVIGDRDFSQFGLRFDGFQAWRDWPDNHFKAEFFYAKLVESFFTGQSRLGTDAGDPGNDNNVYLLGAYGTWYKNKDWTVEPYWIFVKDNGTGPDPANLDGQRDRHTFGARWFGDRATKEKGGIGWNVNANWQMISDAKADAWSVDAVAKYTMSNTKWKPVFWVQYAYAPGDSQAGEGYNPLFQDNHTRYGYSDLFYLENLMVLGAGVEFTAKENWNWGIALRHFRIDNTSDPLSPAVFSNFGTGVGVSNDGVSKDLANEVDLYMKHTYSDNLALEVAYAWVNWDGAFADSRTGASTTAGIRGHAGTVQRAYVNVVVSF